MQGIKWIFFDVGSTLVDETECYNHRIREAIAGTDITFEQFQEKRLFFQKQNLKGDLEALNFFGLPKTPWHKEDEVPYPEAEEILRYLKGLGYRLGVIANQSLGTAERLEKWKLLQYFDVVAASAELGVAKPDPAIFEKAMELAGCTAEEAAMIGDRLDNDIVPAKKLGMKTVWAKFGFAAYQDVEEIEAENRPDAVIENLEELKKYFNDVLTGYTIPAGSQETYKYVVVCSTYKGKWLFSRHKKRTTWETQGGHVEAGETALEAARRELYEESGVTKVDLYPVCDYKGFRGPRFSYGMVFLAVVHELGILPESEMQEVKVFDKLPENLTYPMMTPLLVEEAGKFLKTANEITFTLEDTKPWESKLGGCPYIERPEDYPIGIHGRPMMFLAQINLEEMPPLKDFPAKGLMQFYIEDVDPLGYDEPCVVKYIETYVKDEAHLVKENPYREHYQEQEPFERNGKITFWQREMPMSSTIKAFDELVCVVTREEAQVLEEACDASGSRVGGYPHFEQNPPHYYSDGSSDVLLLQLDVERTCGIMFGDAGNCTFLISGEALKNRDFTKAKYDWQCG